MDQSPEAVAERMRDVVIEFGLRRLEAATDTHVITVEEPYTWGDETELQTAVREIDI